MFSPVPTTRTTAAWQAKVRHAVDLLVAFATLEDLPGAPHDHADGPAHQLHHHPTRRRPATQRRPGTPTARHHACASPLPRQRPRTRATAHG